MKIWITGALGMLGQELLHTLPQFGFHCVGNDKQEVDITDIAKIKAFVLSYDITHIVNCAAYTLVDQAELEEDLARKVNVDGAKNLAEVSKQFGLPLVHFSTDYIFDGNAKSPYKEEDIANPLNIYGKTKLEAEEMIEEGCIIRTSWLIGKNGENFVDKMLHLMQERQEINVVDDQIGRPTFCSDLAMIVPKMLGQKGTFHFANSGQTTWYEFARQIYHDALSLGFPLEVKAINPVTSKKYPQKALRPAYSVLDTGKIETLLGQEPRPWKEALNDYLRKKIKGEETCKENVLSAIS
jgi:dTDP-4-dehydrorhamnose reductase